MNSQNNLRNGSYKISSSLSLVLALAKKGLQKHLKALNYNLMSGAKTLVPRWDFKVL